MSPEIPTTRDQITPTWLTSVLGLGKGEKVPPSITVTRVGEPYGFASEVYRVLAAAAASPPAVVVKLWRTDGFAGTREPAFYESFAGGPGLRLARCYHAAVDIEKRRGVLVLEDFSGALQGDCLEILDADRAGRLAKDMAVFHAYWARRPEVFEAAWLPSLGAEVRDSEWFDARRALFLERSGADLQASCRPLFDAAADLERQSRALLRGIPETLIHGDLHMDNLMFEPNGRAVVLDWARVSRGPGALDLCDVMLMAKAADAPAIFDAYLGQIRAEGAALETDRLAKGIAGAMLRKFILGTYGTARWPADTPRKVNLLRASIARVQEAVLAWRERHSESSMTTGGEHS